MSNQLTQEITQEQLDTDPTEGLALEAEPETESDEDESEEAEG
jgi:hypothetical protein